MSVITVSAGVFTTYAGDEVTLKMRIFCRKTFSKSTGGNVVRGRVGTNRFYDEIDCTVLAGVVSHAGFTIDSTSDGSPNTSYYSFALFTDAGKHIETPYRRIQVPASPTSTMLGALVTYTNASGPVATERTYTRTVIDAMFASLTNMATKATEAIRGAVTLDEPSIDPNDPKAISDGSSKVGGVLGSYVRASLPAANHGQTARVTDSTRGIWRYDETLVHWMPTDPGRVINPLDFCNPVASSDCTAGLQAAIDVLDALGGGTIEFPAGYTFQCASELDLSRTRNIRFIGTSTGRWYPGTTINLKYTGTGSRFLDIRSSTGFTCLGMNIRYSNTGFTGTLIEGGHDGSGADAQQMRFRDNVLGGIEFSLAEAANPASAHADNAAVILDLGFSIIGVVEDNHFVYGAVGILGESASKGYAYVFKIDGNCFNYVPCAIYDAGSLWYVKGNTFEPDLDGKVKAVGSSGSFYSRGLVFEQNYAGDTVADNTVPMVNMKVLGGTFKNNWFTVNYNGVGMQLFDSDGVDFLNNRFETLLSGIQVQANTAVKLDGAAGTNLSIGIIRNSMNVTTPIALTGTNKYWSQDNTKGGVQVENRLTSYLQIGNGLSGAVDAAAVETITIGEATAVTTGKVGSAIRRVQSTFSTIFRAGGLIIQSRTDGNSTETSFVNGLTTTPQLQLRPEIARFSVPLGYQPIVAGIGGTATQGAGSGKATAVTLSKVSGNITMNAANLATGATVSFVLTNTLIEADDELNLRHASAGTRFAYDLDYACGTGSVTIYVKNNTAGDLAEAIVLSFHIIRRAIA